MREEGSSGLRFASNYHQCRTGIRRLSRSLIRKAHRKQQEQPEQPAAMYASVITQAPLTGALGDLTSLSAANPQVAHGHQNVMQTRGTTRPKNGPPTHEETRFCRIQRSHSLDTLNYSRCSEWKREVEDGMCSHRTTTLPYIVLERLMRHSCRNASFQ